jgi:branched-chain amino acid transport system substrate-binding protein
MGRYRVGAAVAAVGLLALACGGSSGGNGGGGGNKGTIKIGIELPESGSEASDGIPTKNGVDFAVKQKGSINGFTLETLNKDDSVSGVHNPQKGAQNVQEFISDPKVLGFVGPFNSSVAKAEIPIANGAHLAMISPANTNECLTKELASCSGLAKQLRPNGPNNYFRVAATDDLQGPAMADYAYDTLKITKVAVASDNEVYGKGIADTFSKEYQKKGGSIVKRQDFDIPSTNDFKPFLSSAAQAGAKGIYFGGTDSNKGCVVRAQMKGIFPAEVPEMGGDGLQTQQCLKDAADNATGLFSTVAAADADQISDAKSTIDAFKKAYPNGKNDYGAYTMPAYDAANILIEAIGRAINDNGGNMPSREQVRAEVAKTKNYKGVLGTTSFDSNGDTSAKIISFYEAKVQGSSPLDWVFVKQQNFANIST